MHQTDYWAMLIEIKSSTNHHIWSSENVSLFTK